jgi:hypothetical protein
MISNRRKFIHKFTLLLTGLPFALQAQGQKECKSFKLTTTKVAGLQYNDASGTHFTDNQRLQFKREHDNAYDKYAVAIYAYDKKVGYIPKENSRIIASLLDNGIMLEAKVRYFDADKPAWERLWISVWQVG